jgi:hypothetical protein
MVGLASEQYQTHQQPGGQHSWVLTDDGKASFLLHDSAKPFGSRVLQGTTVCFFACGRDDLSMT